MKTVIAALILLSTMTAMASDSVTNCNRVGNVNHTLNVVFSDTTLDIKAITINELNPLTQKIESTTILPTAQVYDGFWYFMVTLETGRNMLVPYAVFSPATTSDLILDYTTDQPIHYKCTRS